MKWLKRFLIGLGIVIAIILITALFVKKEYAVQREIVISRNVGVVFDFVRLLKNQNEYSVWAKMDPNMKKEYRGEDGTVGFVSAWASDNKQVGRGEQEIKKITDGRRIDFILRFFEPFEATDLAYMTTEPIDEKSTRVTWGFDGSIPYPLNLLLLGMDMDGMIGQDLEKGLGNLKSILEETR